MSITCCWPDFIAASLSDANPPDLPLLREDWAGMAFDRNLYEDFAPNDVWVAWLSALSKHFADIAMCAVRCSESSDGGNPVEIERGLDGLRSYWLEDGNFMRDHFLFSRDGRWVVKLDQDVTLFAGDVTFLADVVARLGGVEHVEKMMRRDLIGTAEDVVGLGGYVKGLLAPLNASTPQPGSALNEPEPRLKR